MTKVIAFDVNETLLDLRALDPHFEELFGSAALRTQWFGQMLQLAFVGGLTGSYVDFGTAQRAALKMLGARAAELRDRGVIRHPPGGDQHVGNVLAALALDPPRGAVPLRIGVEQQRRHLSSTGRRNAVWPGDSKGQKRRLGLPG